MLYLKTSFKPFIFNYLCLFVLRLLVLHSHQPQCKQNNCLPINCVPKLLGVQFSYGTAPLSFSPTDCDRFACRRRSDANKCALWASAFQTSWITRR